MKILLGVIGILLSFPAFSDESCVCPRLECGGCETQTGVEFYTESCQGGQRLKSCVRPVCEVLDPLPRSCLAEGGQEGTEWEFSKTSSLKTNASFKNSPSRQPASLQIFQSPSNSPISKTRLVGRITALKGRPFVKRTGKKLRLVKQGYLFQGDEVFTGKEEFVSFVLQDGSQVRLYPLSDLRLSYFDFDYHKTKVLMDLEKGLVRSQVRPSVSFLKSGYFMVRTRDASVQVKGTDFFVKYFKKGARFITEVATLKGVVSLKSREGEKEVSVAQGQKGRYVIEGGGLFDKEEMERFVARGFMTPVYQMTEAEIQELLKGSHRYKVSQQKRRKKKVKKLKKVLRKRASLPQKLPKKQKISSLCMDPAGDFNQCMWKCVNNPKGSSSCRTDLPQVKCVRMRCNANGIWAEAFRLPASSGQVCLPQKIKVGPCDY
ncbi:MAG: hypothetical protein D6797_03135 [Bdellovibrio sp.]|nr:MAG: hypothetical protein D6797_03135 [Bdellovibrio sp.]